MPSRERSHSECRSADALKRAAEHNGHHKATDWQLRDLLVIGDSVFAAIRDADLCNARFLAEGDEQKHDHIGTSHNKCSACGMAKRNIPLSCPWLRNFAKTRL